MRRRRFCRRITQLEFRRDGRWHLFRHRVAVTVSQSSFLDFATGKTEVIAPVEFGYFGFSVSPDRKWILYDQTIPSSNELVLAEGFQ